MSDAEQDVQDGGAAAAGSDDAGASSSQRLPQDEDGAGARGVSARKPSRVPYGAHHLPQSYTVAHDPPLPSQAVHTSQQLVSGGASPLWSVEVAAVLGVLGVCLLLLIWCMAWWWMRYVTALTMVVVLD